jgi:hypothetical protein
LGEALLLFNPSETQVSIEDALRHRASAGEHENRKILLIRLL